MNEASDFIVVQPFDTPTKKKDDLPLEAKVALKKYAKENISFSFAYLDRSHKAFSCFNTEPRWFLTLFDRLKTMSTISKDELRKQTNTYRYHSTDFTKSTFKLKECPSFNNEFLEQIDLNKVVQFGLGTANGRVHCIEIDNTMFIYWLDPHHSMYHNQRYGNMILGEYIPNDYELKIMELNELKDKYELLQEEFKDLYELLGE